MSAVRTVLDLHVTNSDWDTIMHVTIPLEARSRDSYIVTVDGLYEDCDLRILHKHKTPSGPSTVVLAGPDDSLDLWDIEAAVGDIFLVQTRQKNSKDGRISDVSLYVTVYEPEAYGIVTGTTH